MNTRACKVPVHIIDPSSDASARWLDALCVRLPDPIHRMTGLPGDLHQQPGGIWILVIGDACSPEEVDRSLKVACEDMSDHRFVVLIEDPDQMPQVPGTVWLPLDASESEMRRWIDWMSRSILDGRALRLALQCPVDSLNPVVGFDGQDDLIFANLAAQELLDQEYGPETITEKLRSEASAVLDGRGGTGECVVECRGRTYAFRFVSDTSLKMVHGHGFDITGFVHDGSAREDLDRQSRYKDVFLRSISHELRGPLNAVLGCTEAMREGVYGNLEEAQLEAVQSIRTSGKHLLKLINDILDVSRIEAGCLQLDAQPVGVQTLCDSVVQITRGSAEAKDISLSVDISGASQVIHADPLRVRQVLLNLMGNAVKFTPQGGEVGLDVRRDTANDAVVFRVWDTGPGISSEDAEVIFEPFVQSDAAHTSQQIGTGLGLALARQLAELHGGDVSLEAFDGPGAILELRLPVGEVSEVPAEDPLATSEWFMAESKPMPEGQAETVLIAEDTDSNYQHTRDLLVSLGYRVERAHNGQEAVDHCMSERPDVVLMDIDMPVMNGLDAIRLLREEAQTRDVPIIAVTAMANIVDARACMQAGASAYLAKPFALRSLMSTMTSLVA